MEKPPVNHARITRRQACRLLAAGSAAACLPLDTASGASCAHLPKFQLHYALASSMYGKLPLEEIAGEVHKIGAERIDLWPEHHANQREQMEAMGHQRIRRTACQHASSWYATPLRSGPFGLRTNDPHVEKLGGSLVSPAARALKTWSARKPRRPWLNSSIKLIPTWNWLNSAA